MNNLITFGRKKGDKDKKKRLRRAILTGLGFGAVGGAIGSSVQEGFKYGYRRVRNQPNRFGNIGRNIAAASVLGALGEGVAQGVLEKYRNKIKENIQYNKQLELAEFEKKKVKVKQFIRKGKLVKSHIRTDDRNRKKNIIKGSAVLASGGLLIALARNRKIQVILNIASNQTKNNFKQWSNVIPKKLEQVNNPAEKLNLVRNQKGIKNTTNTVFFVDDLNTKETFVFKQSKMILGFKVTGTYTHGNEQAAEALASEIGEKMGISVQSTKIVPANATFPGKEAGLPGSLHGIAKGEGVDKAFPNRKFNVQHLRYKTDDKQIIDDLFMQKDIAEISAFDTFLGNEDRNPNNLFYDKKSGKFTGIDHGRLFAFPFNYKKLKGAIYSEYSRMTPAQKNNLRAYNAKLKEMISTYTPEDLAQKYDKYFIKALSGSDSKVYEQALKSRQTRIRNIFNAHAESSKLSKDIDILLGKN